MSWNLKELRDVIQMNKEQSQDLLDLIHSVENSIYIFRYHLYTARDTNKAFFEPNDASNPEHLALMLGATDRQSEYEWAKLTIQANTVAAIYTVRSLYDVFSQLVRGLLLEDTISVEKCNIHLVRDKLKPGELKNCLDRLLKSQGFKYVNDFANVSKHRSMIAYNPHIDFIENKAGVRFREFSYRDRKHPEKWSQDVLEMVLETKNTIIEAGIALNDTCLRANV